MKKWVLLVAAMALCQFVGTSIFAQPAPAGKEPATAARQEQARIETNQEKLETQPESAAADQEQTQSQTDTTTSAPKGKEVRRLANLEALVSIIANVIGIGGMAIGIPLMLGVPVGIYMLFRKDLRKYAFFVILPGPMLLTTALVAPGLIKWILAALEEIAIYD